ncbi:hypothetical protein D3C76_1779840 [compost metagenome]
MLRGLHARDFLVIGLILMHRINPGFQEIDSRLLTDEAPGNRFVQCLDDRLDLRGTSLLSRGSIVSQINSVS